MKAAAGEGGLGVSDTLLICGSGDRQMKDVSFLAWTYNPSTRSLRQSRELQASLGHKETLFQTK